jgi:hypothetical protein
MTDVMTRVNKHYTRAIEHYGAEAVLGVFLYGSWNYNTNTPDSDVDTKCILVPNLYSLAIKPYEVKHLHIDDEVCECMTIMHMVANWKKQNINFVEIMFTEYCKINPIYKDFWEKRFPLEAREQVARYDLRQAIHSMVHQAIHTIKQDPTCPKKIMNGARIANTLDNLLNNPMMSYKDCIWMRDDVRELRFKEPEESVVKLLLFVLEGYLESIDEFADQGSYKPGVDACLNDLVMGSIYFRERGLHF